MYFQVEAQAPQKAEADHDITVPNAIFGGEPKVSSNVNHRIIITVLREYDQYLTVV